MPWIVAVAALLVVPGFIFSFALPVIGGVMLGGLAVDYLIARGNEPRPRLRPIAQFAIAVLAAGLIGGLIAVGAWIDK